MNGKLSSELPHENSDKVEILNPFVHHLELETTFDKIKTAICTIILLPIRVAIICFLLISGWLLACIGLWGLTEKDLQNQPVTGWRSKVRFVASHIILWMFTAGGFRIKVRGKQLKRSKAPVVALAPHSSFMDSLAMVYMGGPSIVAKGETASIPFFGSMFSLLNIAVKLTPILCFLGKSTYAAGGMYVIIKGKQATRKEAPILVIAPHSTFLDGGIVYATGFPSIIVRRESGTNPYIGKLINFTQPIYVWRDDPDSRQKTIKEIINRATSELDWPQILIFPEGTCTNRSCLITFKPGAFYPGVPIQPVCIRYPNKLDTVTWTWEGPSALKLLWLTLTQVYSYCEIEFLPVYVPNEEEKRDPKLFANNVRAVMARALGVPVSDYTYDDCRLMAKAKEMNLPNAISLVEVQKLRHKLRLDENNIEENIVNSQLMCKDCSRITLTEFTNYLNLPINDASVHQLFKIYDKNCAGVIDFREYLLGVLALSNNRSVLDILKLACKVYDSSGVGRLSAKDFTKVLFHTLAMHEDTSLEIFRQIDSSKLGYITFENFKSYAEKRAEFSHLFTMKKVDNFKPRNGEICPNEYNKKID